jgi:hypothetical protein
MEVEEAVVREPTTSLVWLPHVSTGPRRHRFVDDGSRHRRRGTMPGECGHKGFRSMWLVPYKFIRSKWV